MFVKYAFLADHVTQAGGGKISASGIFDKIYSRDFPAKHRDMVLVARLEGTQAEKGEHQLTIELRDSKGNTSATLNPKISFDSKSKEPIITAGLIVQFQDIVFQKPDRYEIVIFINERFLQRVTFTVQRIKIVGQGDK